MINRIENLSGPAPEIEFNISEVRKLNPTLLENYETRWFILNGIELNAEVTKNYGTPSNPKWASGTHEKNVLMSYHNGGRDGHTSVGEGGAGAPRNVLLISKAVNDAAGKEVFNPLTTAIGFYAAEAHDLRQLCGRSLLPEGQHDNRGDERLSAEYAARKYFFCGGESKYAALIYDAVMATAFNPQTYKQNVDYSSDRTRENILLQELVAASDLLGPATSHGLLGSIRNTIESLCLLQKGRIIQKRIAALNLNPSTISTTDLMLEVIEHDELLKDKFMENFENQAGFISDALRYSDKFIKEESGVGIDDLYPERQTNATLIKRYHHAILAGEKNIPQMYKEAKDDVINNHQAI